MSAPAPSLFTGSWKYQSFVPNLGSIRIPSGSPTFTPWSPLGDLTVNAGGTTGVLTLAAGTRTLTLNLAIEVVTGTPATLHIKATMPLGPGTAFTNELHGWFTLVDPSRPAGPGNPLIVRGSIIQTSADLPGVPSPQPIGTVGFFILEPR